MPPPRAFVFPVVSFEAPRTGRLSQSGTRAPSRPGLSGESVHNHYRPEWHPYRRGDVGGLHHKTPVLVTPSQRRTGIDVPDYRSEGPDLLHRALWSTPLGFERWVSWAGANSSSVVGGEFPW